LLAILSMFQLVGLGASGLEARGRTCNGINYTTADSGQRIA
jgi:hypothetical protein